LINDFNFPNLPVAKMTITVNDDAKNIADTLNCNVMLTGFKLHYSTLTLVRQKEA
jgi:hypothetical protein